MHKQARECGKVFHHFFLQFGSHFCANVTNFTIVPRVLQKPNKKIKCHSAPGGKDHMCGTIYPRAQKMPANLRQ